MIRQLIFTFILSLILSTSAAQTNSVKKAPLEFETQIDSLLKVMTIDEKVGQMNQYNGFWDATGPTPQEGTSEIKYDHL